MEAPVKPLPDIDALRYHGTPEHPDIKIFVSHRIDLDSKTIDNPLYIPVRCGAVFDTRENVQMLGDDTGDNISDKRMRFCELTVQYWAWKNVQADYYGLCHYRRYLSFAQERATPGEQNLVRESVLCEESAKKYNLLDPALMEDRLRKLDAMFQEEFDVREWPTPNSSRTMEGLWREMNYFMENSALDLMLKTLVERYPDYAEAAERYMQGHYFRGFNCFILKKELFFDLCQFEFSILFDIEKKLQTARYSELRNRTPAYLAEILESIWIDKNFIHGENRNYEITQLVLFHKNAVLQPLLPARPDNNIPIILFSNNYHTPYTAVTIQSVLYHASAQYHYDFIVLAEELSETNRWILEGLCKGHGNVTIRVFDPEPTLYPYRCRLSIDPGVDALLLCRAALPAFLPEYDKVICLSNDLVLETDIARLYEIPMGDNYLAAVRDTVVQGYVEGGDPRFVGYYDDKLQDVGNYVNTGVAVHNLAAMRSSCDTQEILLLASKESYLLQEQDVINILVEGKCLFLDPRWNVLAYCRKAGRKVHRYAPCQFQQAYKASREDPYVIHWSGAKPWQHPGDDLAERYWFYARMSPLYEVILQRLLKPKEDKKPKENKKSKKKTKPRSWWQKILPKPIRRSKTFRALLRTVRKIRHPGKTR